MASSKLCSIYLKVVATMTYEIYESYNYNELRCIQQGYDGPRWI